MLTKAHTIDLFADAVSQPAYPICDCILRFNNVNYSPFYQQRNVTQYLFCYISYYHTTIAVAHFDKNMCLSAKKYVTYRIDMFHFM